MKDWKQHFGPQILSRGLDYYKNNAVDVLKANNESVKATVTGYRKYQVNVNLKEDSFYCECPYYSREGNCKHIAALLYCIEDHPEIIGGNDDDIYNLLSSMSHEDLVNFLVNEASKDEDLLIRLKLFNNHDVCDEYYIDKLNRSFGSCVDVLVFIDEELQDLFARKRYGMLLKLARAIVDYAEEIDKEGMYNASYEIIRKIDDLTYGLEGKGVDDQVCEFLGSIILESDDDGILDTFSETYSRFGDIEKFFDEHYTSAD